MLCDEPGVNPRCTRGVVLPGAASGVEMHSTFVPHAGLFLVLSTVRGWVRATTPARALMLPSGSGGSNSKISGGAKAVRWRNVSGEPVPLLPHPGASHTAAVGVLLPHRSVVGTLLRREHQDFVVVQLQEDRRVVFVPLGCDTRAFLCPQPLRNTDFSAAVWSVVEMPTATAAAAMSRPPPPARLFIPFSTPNSERSASSSSSSSSDGGGGDDDGDIASAVSPVATSFGGSFSDHRKLVLELDAVCVALQENDSHTAPAVLAVAATSRFARSPVVMPPPAPPAAAGGAPPPSKLQLHRCGAHAKK